MAYLDISPMISALQSCPDAFEFSNGELHHIPSRHRFSFDSRHQVRVDASCGCSLLQVCADQQPALYEAFRNWRTNYWRAIEINREFASHFAPPSRLRAWLIKMTARLHRAVSFQGRMRNSESFIKVPAE